MRKVKGILILLCLMLNVLFIPISSSNVYKERVISCYNNGLERQKKISQKEYEYINEKLEKIKKYGMSSERGICETEKLIQYLKERDIIDLTPFLRYLKLGKEKMKQWMPYEKGLLLPFNLFCFVSAWWWTDHAPPMPVAYLSIKECILFNFLFWLLNYLEGKISRDILDFLWILIFDIGVSIMMMLPRISLFSNAFIMATFIETFGLLGKFDIGGTALLFGFTGIKVYGLFGFCYFAIKEWQ